MNARGLELTLHDLTQNGQAVGRLPDGMVVFVPGALPGQTVLAEIMPGKKKFAEGRLLQVLEASPEQREPPCPHSGACGGCPWQGLTYPAQIKYKTRLLRNALGRIGGLGANPAVQTLTVSGNDAEWAYRNKMEFSFAPASDGSVALGLRRRNSREVVEVTGCLLQTPRTMAMLALIRAWARQNKLPAWIWKKQPDGLRHVVIREPASQSSQCLIELITGPLASSSPAVSELAETLLRNGASGFLHSIRHGQSAVAYGEKIVHQLGQTTLTEQLRLNGQTVTFALGSASFFQVNTPAAQKLYQTAADLVRPLPLASTAIAWDLYCGVGGLGIALAPYFSSVIGLEISRQAVALARRNFASSPRLRFEHADVSKLGAFCARHAAPDLVAADPPRSGLEAETVQALLKHRPRHLLMVACNPATLARDLALLDSGYELTAITGLDLFPQTGHVEAVALLNSKESPAA